MQSSETQFFLPDDLESRKGGAAEIGIALNERHQVPDGSEVITRDKRKCQTGQRTRRRLGCLKDTYDLSSRHALPTPREDRGILFQLFSRVREL